LKASVDRLLQRRLMVGALALVLCAFALTTLGSSTIDLSTFLLSNQDRWLLLAQALALFAIGERLGRRANPLVPPEGALLAGGLLVIIACYLGHYWILSGYDISRDEQMAVFDSRIFAAGLLVQPLPPFWQQHASALNDLFMLPVEHPIAWVSAYLPVNALLRTLVGLVADPALTGPLLTAVGLLALYKCARLLWPEDKEAAVVACLLYLTSGQILFAGMTAFAMSAHLTFDMVWLWLFLLRRWQADVSALLIGFLATGLHQPIFHPLFVAPFMLLLLRERAWPRLGLYCAGYAVVCAFWLSWPGWIHLLVAGPNSMTATGIDYWSRLRLILVPTYDARWVEMAANLLRFAAWQNVLLVPLMIAGAGAARRDRTAAAFLATIVISVALMALIQPFQGYGFGYRYMHGLMGSAILLAVHGWRRLQAEHSAMRALFIRSAVVSLLVLIPLQAWMAHGGYSAFAAVERRVVTSGADYFAVGGNDTSFSGALVINEPDLSTRPIRLYADALRGPFITQLCVSRPRVGLPTTRLFRPIDRYFGAPPRPQADKRIATLSSALEAAGCKVMIVDGPVDRSRLFRSAD
jgi:hypothetical protein